MNGISLAQSLTAANIWSTRGQLGIAWFDFGRYKVKICVWPWPIAFTNSWATALCVSRIDSCQRAWRLKKNTTQNNSHASSHLYTHTRIHNYIWGTPIYVVCIFHMIMAFRCDKTSQKQFNVMLRPLGFHSFVAALSRRPPPIAHTTRSPSQLQMLPARFWWILVSYLCA